MEASEEESGASLLDEGAWHEELAGSALGIDVGGAMGDWLEDVLAPMDDDDVHPDGEVEDVSDSGNDEVVCGAAGDEGEAPRDDPLEDELERRDLVIASIDAAGVALTPPEAACIWCIKLICFAVGPASSTSTS